MTRSILVSFLLVLPAFVGEASEVGEDHFVGSVPAEIYGLMKERECSPIKGFYDRLIMFPPFIYVNGLFGGETVIFFVCEIDRQITDDKYKMVIVRTTYSEGRWRYRDLEDCKGEVYYDHMPGGLSILRDMENISDMLSIGYNLWEDTRKYRWTEPKTLFEDNPSWIIDERAEGVGYGLFCVGNNWYNVAYD